TGLWFINGDPFTDWLKTPHSKLWVNGFAGLGKTVLASMAIEKVQSCLASNKSSAVLFFFCDHSSEDSQDIRVILGSFIYQLAIRGSDTRAKLKELQSSRLSSPKVLKEETFEDLYGAFRQVAQPFEEICIVVDGLDE
ncbi:hypothetical protein DL95DRAFT_231845, partial [Leptodontidium sp. 2 PMI_412]